MATGTYKDYGYRPGNRNPSHTYLLPVLDRMLEASPGPVLDIGCGEGNMAKALIRRGHDVFGVDASESGIQLASMDAPGRFFVMDIDGGRLPAELVGIRFNAVISVEVIEHLYAPRSLTALARKVLVPGGELILSTPYHGYVKNLLLAASGRLDRHLGALWDGGHIKFFSRSTLERLLIEEGFSVTGFAGAGRFQFMWRSMVMKARLGA